MSPESIYYLVAAVALPVAASSALFQWRASVGQRKREFRWQQSEAAWKLLDKVFEDEASLIAQELIDGERHTVEVAGQGTVYVSREDMLKALDTDDDSTGAASVVRYAFNSFLYGLERLESAVISGYVLEEDVASPTAYYARLLYEIDETLRPYAESAGYHRALNLITRLHARPVAGGLRRPPASR